AQARSVPHSGKSPQALGNSFAKRRSMGIVTRLTTACHQASRDGRNPAMIPITRDEIRAMVQPGRVQRRLYTDAEIFELELERIFGAAWIYVGHESQVKNPGDFLATRIGRKPLLLVRDAEGRLQLLHNQCAHRGSMVVASNGGHTSEFRCCY